MTATVLAVVLLVGLAAVAVWSSWALGSARHRVQCVTCDAMTRTGWCRSCRSRARARRRATARAVRAHRRVCTSCRTGVAR